MQNWNETDSMPLKHWGILFEIQLKDQTIVKNIFYNPFSKIFSKFTEDKTEFLTYGFDEILAWRYQDELATIKAPRYKESYRDSDRIFFRFYHCVEKPLVFLFSIDKQRYKIKLEHKKIYDAPIELFFHLSKEMFKDRFEVRIASLNSIADEAIIEITPCE